MHEIACPSCNAPSQHDLNNFLFSCPFCSATYHFDMETGEKTVFTEHFIIPNTADTRQTKDIVQEWLKRLHHKPDAAEKEFRVLDVKGISIPFWVVSIEAHTSWKGLTKKQRKQSNSVGSGSNFLLENGYFHKSYRWCISARENLGEYWGMTRLHQPMEKLDVDWDGFPMDSTFSRGRIDELAGTKTNPLGERKDVPAYDVRDFFDFKYANGLPILGIQVSEEEALARAKDHISRYHHELGKLHSDINIHARTEIEVAGVQLIHIPFWFTTYVHQPKSMLKHFRRYKENNVILDGYALGILKGEIAVKRQDKLHINSVVFGIASLVMLLLGILWHPAFHLISLFSLFIAGASGYMSMVKAKNEELVSSSDVEEMTSEEIEATAS